MLIASAVISGYDVAAGSVLAVIRGSYFDKCILILIVTVAAFSLGMATEGAALILLFQLGGSMIDYAYIRTSQTVSAEVYCRAGDAHIQKNGAEETAPAERVVPGDNIIINPGERVPCDCIVLDGGGSLDSSPLGGGTDPLYISEGDDGSLRLHSQKRMFTLRGNGNRGGFNLRLVSAGNENRLRHRIACAGSFKALHDALYTYCSRTCGLLSREFSRLFIKSG